MKVTQAFESLLEQADKSLGEWLRNDQMETGTAAVKYVKTGENRGKLVYVLKSWRIRNPIDRERIKKVAIKKLHDKLLSAALWKLSQQELLYLINSYEKISTALIGDEDGKHVTQVAFRRVSKTLSGRNFDPNTLEFDLEKKGSKLRNLADTQIREKLEEYRLKPAKSEYLSSSAPDELELSVRSYNLLRDQDIETFGELIHVRDLLRVGKLKGLGRKTQIELQKIIDILVESSKDRA